MERWHEAGKPGHWRHLDRSAMRIWTPILALQQVRLEGVGHAAPSSWHVITAGMTKGWCDGPDPSVRPCRVRATPARLSGSQLDDVDQPEDHQHNDDHANDPDATTSVVHFDLPFSCQEGHSTVARASRSPNRGFTSSARASRLGR